jgi:plasmid stabilization system protein ParE
MHFTIIFSREALRDLEEARSWYNLQQKGLGKRLIADVKSIIAAIKQNPYFASVKFANIRTAACNTFPYAVHYEIDETEKYYPHYLHIPL